MKYKYLPILCLILISLQSCNREEEIPCEQCLCFNWIGPTRLSYQDKDNIDLLVSELFTIDSIKVKPLDDNGFPFDEYINIDFIVKNWLVAENDNFYYSYLDIGDHKMARLYAEGVKGIDVDNEFYIYRTGGIDTLNIKWNKFSGPVENCCVCTGFPLEYLKHQGVTITEHTNIAAIIRL